MNSQELFQKVVRMRVSQREIDEEIERVHRILDARRNPELNFNKTQL